MCFKDGDVTFSRDCNVVYFMEGVCDLSFGTPMEVKRERGERL